MPRRELRPFRESDVDVAGAQLAARHRDQRRRFGFLDPQYETAGVAAGEVARLFEAPDASGSVAFDGARMVGFLVGAPRPDPLWGPNVWVEVAGHAADSGETVRDLYAAAAQRWFDEGRTAHYALVPVATEPDLVTAWFRTGFGQQHVHAACPTTGAPTAAPPAPAASTIVIRPAVRDDLDALAGLDLLVPEQLRRSPVFSPIQVPAFDDTRREWAEDFDDDVVLVAELGGVVAGLTVVAPVERSAAHSGLARPDHGAVLGLAAVRPEHRGLGIARHLGGAVLAWAREHGYPVVVTDWRAANLASSRVWPALGFDETFLRLHRNVGY